MKDVDADFYNRADAHIHLSNDQMKTASPGLVSASMMYGMARFNAWLSSASFESGAGMAAARDEAIAYFTGEYRKMLEEHLDDYIRNFERYTAVKK